MKYAPEIPTTRDLHRRHPLTHDQQKAIANGQNRLSNVIRHPGNGFFAGVGACTITDNLPVLRREAGQLKQLEQAVPGLVVAQRVNGWKPRSNSADPHGPETDPRLATRVRTHELVAILAGEFAMQAKELGYPEHVRRYARSLLVGWLGARAAAGSVDPQEARALLEAAAREVYLPIGVKNGQDGDIRTAVARAAAIESLRDGQGAPAFVIYRGSDNALTPEAWEAEYLEALELADGRLVVDPAHGGMRAHTESNGKSVAGQIAAAEHIIDLAQQGYQPAGWLMEASDTASVVDPNMPYAEGLALTTQMARVCIGSMATANV